MSMILTLHPISSRVLDAFLKTPELAFAIAQYDPEEKVSGPDEDLAAWEVVERQHLAQMVRQSGTSLPTHVIEAMTVQLTADFERALSRRILSQPARRRRLLADHSLGPADFGACLNLGQAWHALHFALTGSTSPEATPLGRALIGGIEHGEQVGYGPLQYLDAANVAETAEALYRLEGEDLPQRLRTANDTHQIHAFRPGPATEWVSESYEELREFYRLVAERKQALIQSMT